MADEMSQQPLKVKWWRRVSTWVLVGVVVVLAALTTASIINKLPYKSIALPDAPVTMQPIDDTAYYYGQLTDQEKSIYNTFLQQLNHFTPQVVVLDQPINEQSRQRIEQVLLMSDHKMLDYFSLLGMGKDYGDVVNGQIYTLTPLTATTWSAIAGIAKSNSNQDVGVDQINLLLTKSIGGDYKATYEKMYADMNQKIDDLAAQLPKNSTQADAVQFFYNWEMEYIQYDSDIYHISGLSKEELIKKAVSDPALMRAMTVDETPYAIIDKKTICSGYSNLLDKLLNRVGVHSYMCLGTIEGKNHAWNRVEVGGVSAYIDLTNVYSKKQGVVPQNANFYCISAQDIKRQAQFATDFEYIPTF